MVESNSLKAKVERETGIERPHQKRSFKSLYGNVERTTANGQAPTFNCGCSKTTCQFPGRASNVQVLGACGYRIRR